MFELAPKQMRLQALLSQLISQRPLCYSFIKSLPCTYQLSSRICTPIHRSAPTSSVVYSGQIKAALGQMRILAAGASFCNRDTFSSCRIPDYRCQRRQRRRRQWQPSPTYTRARARAITHVRAASVRRLKQRDKTRDAKKNGAHLIGLKSVFRVGGSGGDEAGTSA